MLLGLQSSLDWGNAGVYANIKLATIFNSNLMFCDRQSLFASAWDVFVVNDISEEIVDRMSLFKNKTQACVLGTHGHSLCYLLFPCSLSNLTLLWSSGRDGCVQVRSWYVVWIHTTWLVVASPELSPWIFRSSFPQFPLNFGLTWHGRLCCVLPLLSVYPLLPRLSGSILRELGLPTCGSFPTTFYSNTQLREIECLVCPPLHSSLKKLLNFRFSYPTS